MALRMKINLKYFKRGHVANKNNDAKFKCKRKSQTTKFCFSSVIVRLIHLLERNLTATSFSIRCRKATSWWPFEIVSFRFKDKPRSPHYGLRGLSFYVSIFQCFMKEETTVNQSKQKGRRVKNWEPDGSIEASDRKWDVDTKNKKTKKKARLRWIATLVAKVPIQRWWIRNKIWNHAQRARESVMDMVRSGDSDKNKTQVMATAPVASSY